MNGAPRSPGASGPGCRAFVGGFGRPGQRDLDFGRQLIDCLQQLEWPEGVVVEDLSCSVPLVLHRLQELRPAKVVLLGAVARELDPPATVRRYRLPTGAARPEDVRRGLEDAASGVTDIDHTLAVARHWGGLPPDTVVIEVEPAETWFGLGFSEELARCFDPILDMVREELVGMDGGGDVGRELRIPEANAEGDALAPSPAGADPSPGEPSGPMAELLGYARDHAEARLQSRRAPAIVERAPCAGPGLVLAGRVQPWGVGGASGGDWYDTVPLENGLVGIVVGNVAGRGVELAATMADLRAAARAYAVVEGDSPSRLVRRLDRLVATTGLGQGTRLAYLVVEPGSGDVRFVNAGGCPPLLVDGASRHGRFVDAGRSGPLAVPPGASRPEGTLQLGPDSTLLLFTDGLVESRITPRAAGLERLRRSAVGGPSSLDELCDHVLATCTVRRDDDVCLLGVRVTAGAVPVEHRPSHRSHH